jgi:hypothetical protein
LSYFRTPLSQGAAPTNYQDAAAAAAWPSQADQQAGLRENGPPNSTPAPAAAANGGGPAQFGTEGRASSQPAQRTPDGAPQFRAHFSQPRIQRWQQPQLPPQRGSGSPTALSPRVAQHGQTPASPEPTRRPKRAKPERQLHVNLALDSEEEEEEEPLRVSRRTATRPRARALSDDEGTGFPADQAERFAQPLADPAKRPEGNAATGTQRARTAPKFSGVRTSGEVCVRNDMTFNDLFLYLKVSGRSLLREQLKLHELIKVEGLLMHVRF